MKNIVKYSILFSILLFAVGFATGSVGPISDNAIVYVDEKTDTYYSPLSLDQNKVNSLSLKRSTLKTVRTLGYKMNEEDKQNGYFQQEGRSLSGMFLEKIGILPKLKDRVAPNGDWWY